LSVNINVLRELKPSPTSPGEQLHQCVQQQTDPESRSLSKLNSHLLEVAPLT